MDGVGGTVFISSVNWVMMIGQSGPGDTRGHQSAEDNVAGHSGPNSGLSYLPDLLNISTSQVWYTVIANKVK